MKEIVIYGGSFSPIHLGHMALAEACSKSLSPHEIWLMPSFEDAFKGLPLLSKERMLFLNQAVASYQGFFQKTYGTRLLLSNFELQKKGVSYTHQTLKILKEQHLDCHFSFLLGMDAFLTLPRWYQAEELMRSNHFIVGARAPFNQKILEREQVEQRIQTLGGSFSFVFLDVPLSSTELRKEVLQEKEGVLQKFSPKGAEDAFLSWMQAWTALQNRENKAE